MDFDTLIVAEFAIMLNFFCTKKVEIAEILFSHPNIYYRAFYTFMLLCLPAYFVTEIGLSTIEPSMPLTDTEYVLTSPVSSS